MYLMLENINVSYGNKAILKKLTFKFRKVRLCAYLEAQGRAKPLFLT